MKNYLINTNNRFLILLFLPFAAFGLDVAKVGQVSGHAYLVYNGETRPITKGMSIPLHAEVLTTEDAKIVISDNANREYFLSSSGHLNFDTEKIIMNSGYLWIKAKGQENPFQIETPNAWIKFSSGEGILSFDPSLAKTQILSINGQFNFANVFDKKYNVTVPNGQFSFIDQSYENGIPRSVTPIGQISFDKITALFLNGKVIAPQAVANHDMQMHAETKTDSHHETPKEVHKVEHKVEHKAEHKAEQVAEHAVKHQENGHDRKVASVHADKHEKIKHPEVNPQEYLKSLDHSEHKAAGESTSANFKHKSEVQIKIWGKTTYRKSAPLKKTKIVEQEREVASVHEEKVEAVVVHKKTSISEKKIIAPKVNEAAHALKRYPASKEATSVPNLEKTTEIEVLKNSVQTEKYSEPVKNLIHDLESFDRPE